METIVKEIEAVEEKTVIYYTCYESPLETLLLTSEGAALTGLSMVAQKHAPQIGRDWIRRDDAAPFPEAKRQLDAYFAGTLTRFDLPLSAPGTPFQRRVWEELRRIPYGQTVSYGELAERIGSPNASRAVGLANGRNPLFLVVPCHRVIGANGKLTGYGGGISRKAALLDYEAAVRTHGAQAFPRLTGTADDLG